MKYLKRLITEFDEWGPAATVAACAIVYVVVFLAIITIEIVIGNLDEAQAHLIRIRTPFLYVMIYALGYNDGKSRAKKELR